MSTTKTLFKIAVYLLAGVALTVIFPFAVFSLMNGSSDLADTLDANWGIVLSDEAGWEELYHADSGASFNGDGWRYHIVTYANEEAIANMVAWSAEDCKTRWNESYQSAIEEWLCCTNAERSMAPVYDGCVYWYQSDTDGSEIILCWNKAEGKFYIAESFM